MTKLFPLLISAVCLFPAYLLADEPDSGAPSDDRIKTLQYNESDVYTITTRYGYQTNIVFAQQEEIQTISVGDRSLWQIIPTGFRMFIRPMAEGATTNMTVITNKHSYQFDLKSVVGGNDIVDEEDCRKSAKTKAAKKACSQGNSADLADVIYVAKFTYPDSLPPVVAPAVPVNLLPNPAPASSPPPVMPPPASATPPEHSDVTRPAYTNYNYTYAGSDDIAPLQVYDNGTTTFIKFRNLPASAEVYAVSDTGAETPVSSLAKDNMLMVDVVTPQMTVKSSAGTIAIYNEMLTPR